MALAGTANAEEIADPASGFSGARNASLQNGRAQADRVELTDQVELAENLRFRHLTVSDGLAQSSVHSLLQDHLGFVWIGTEDGLQRYDGEHYVRFTADPFRADSLSHNMVEELFEDRTGRLWVGTFGGLDALDPTSGGFVSLAKTPLADAAGWSVSAMAEDAAGRLWIATREHGVAVISASRDEVDTLHIAGGTLPSDRVQALAAAEGGMFVGFADAPPILRMADGRTRVIDGLASSDVRQFALDGDNVWLATAAGLGHFSWDAAALSQDSATLPLLATTERHDPDRASSLASDELASVLVDHRGLLWVGGQRGLDVRLGEGSFRHFRHRPGDLNSLGHDQIQTLLEDAGGLIFIGTALGGVTVLDPRPRFAHVQLDPSDPGSLPSNVVRAFAEDAAGRLWIGTDGGGLCRHDGAGEPFCAQELAQGSKLLGEQRIWSLLADRGGDLWVGGQDALFRVSSQNPSSSVSFSHQPESPNSLGPGSVRDLAEDDDGRLWVALFGGGLDRLSPGEQRFEHFRHHDEKPFTLPNDLVFTLLRDRRGHLWIGTVAGLARRTSDGRFHSYHHDPTDRSTLLGDLVRAVHQDGEGNLWVGTDAGLNRLPADLVSSPPVPAPNNRGFTHFTESDGLPDNSVNGIVEDAVGRLWLSTNRGLSRFDPTTRSFTNFDPNDGLQGFEFNAGAAFKSPGGEIYFGGLAGYNVFRPEEIVVNDFMPPVRFVGLESLGEKALPGEETSWLTEDEPPGPAPIVLGDPVVVPYDQAAVRIDFAALDYSQPIANRYAYQLEGPGHPSPQPWRDLGTQGSVTLVDLAAGDYVLRVRGSNDDGLWNEQGASLGVTVLPSPWRTGWAYGLYAGFGVGFLGLLLWQRRRRQALDQRVDDVTQVSEQRLQLALEGSGDGLWDWNLESGEIFRSGIAEMLGFDPTELPNDATWRQRWIHPEDRQRVEDAIEAHLQGTARSFEAEYRARDSGGSWRFILDRGTVVERGPSGEPRRMTGTFKDMTRHKKTERELRLWSTVFEAIDEGVMVLDALGRVRAVNDAFCRLFGRPRHSLLGRPAIRLRSPAHDDAFYRRLRRELLVRGTWRGEIRQQRTDDSERLMWVEIRAVEEPGTASHGIAGSGTASHGIAADADSVPREKRPREGRLARPSHYVVVVSDITHRKRAEEELRYLADYDPLTGLPNRSMFAREAAAAVAKAREDDRALAVLFADLDQFKQINDTLGHLAGDKLLQEAARRLLTSVRTDDLVARLGGDELIVLLHDPTGRGIIDRDSVTLVAKRILGAFTPSFLLDGQDLSVSTSLGIAFFPGDGEDIESLLQHADTAMYEAKAQGRNRFCFYTREMSERALTRMTLDHRLRRALTSDGLALYYQPVFDLLRGELVGVEALLRWPQQDGEVWLPETFLGIAEETGLILPLGAWVLETACQQAAAWRQAGRLLEMSVNVASAQLDQEDFAAVVERVLESSGLEPKHLCFEITEDAIQERTEGRLAQLEKLRKLGLRLSIDDFGTGFSSLGHLQRLHFDELKIDRSFVENVSDDDASSIARTILAMAEGMDVEVVAEGVETLEQLEILSRLGCRRVQGHLISQPLPADELEALMSSTEAPWRRLPVGRRRRGRRAAKGSANLRPVE